MSKRLITLAALLVACLASMMAFGGSPASAQEDEATYPLAVNVVQDGEPLGDVTVLVTSEDGAIDYGSCVTAVAADPAGCQIDVDAGTTVAVSVDAASIPDGYALLEDPVIFEVPAEVQEGVDVTVELTAQEDTVPDEADTDEEAAADEPVEGAADATPSAELPSTGTNPDNGSTTSTPFMLLGAFAALAVLVSGGFFITRRASNQNR
jgi:hypothetical protein